MRLLGRAGLQSLRGKNDETDRWIDTWAAEVTTAHWKRPADLFLQFPKATEKNGTFSFPIANSQSNLDVIIAFPQGITLVISPIIK